jgi:hypothetical protein
MDQVFAVDFVKVFGEDVAMLEAQQCMIESDPDAPHIDIRVDAAPLAARRMLAAMIEAEQSPVRSERSDACT